MNKTKLLVNTLVAGGIAGFALDPVHGRRRRALMKDKARQILRAKQDALDIMLKDFSNRFHGKLYLLWEQISQTPIEDSVLEKRIRSLLGHLSTNPGAIKVESNQGHITLHGDVLASEVQDIVRGIKKLYGINKIHNLLKVHSSQDDAPTLQGTGSSPSVPSRWTPATALLMSGAGLMLAATGLMRRDMVGGVLSTAGTMLILKSFAEVEARFTPTGADSFAYALQNPPRGTRRSRSEGRKEILQN